jgi:hypothetical protein
VGGGLTSGRKARGSTSSRAQCRGKNCATTRDLVALQDELIEMRHELEKERAKLEQEQRMRSTLVEGIVRAAHADLVTENMHLKSRSDELEKDKKDRVRYKLIREEEATAKAGLAERLATALAEAARLEAKLAARDRKEAGDARALARDARQQGREEMDTSARQQVGRAEIKASSTISSAEALAAAAIVAADERAASSEKRAAAAEAISASELVDDSRKAKDASEYDNFLSIRREERLRAKCEAMALKTTEGVSLPKSRTPDEWAALGSEARKTACRRDRLYLLNILNTHAWRAEDIAFAIANCKIPNLVELMFKTQPFFTVYYRKTNELMAVLKEQHYGVSFALFLLYELRLTLPKVLSITQVGCKRFDKISNTYRGKALLYDAFHTNSKTGLTYIPVPRITPPSSKLVPLIKSIEERIGVTSAEDGKRSSHALSHMFPTTCYQYLTRALVLCV